MKIIVIGYGRVGSLFIRKIDKKIHEGADLARTRLARRNVLPEFKRSKE